MPNPEQIRKTQERRAARASNKAANVQAAEDQEHELAALADRLKAGGARTNEAGLRTDQIGMAAAITTGVTTSADDDDEDVSKPTTSAKAKSRAAQRAASQVAAAKQAEIDVQNTVAPAVDEHDLSIYRARGEEPPLHVLNAIAKKADKAMRDDATEAAQAAGKAAYDVLTERRNNRNHESRHKTVEVAQRAMAAAKASVGAADPAKTE